MTDMTPEHAIPTLSVILALAIVLVPAVSAAELPASPQTNGHRVEASTERMWKATPRPVVQMSAQTAAGLVASSIVPLGLAMLYVGTGVVGTYTNVPEGVIAAGGLGAGMVLLASPGLVVDHVGRSAGGRRHTVATVAGSLIGYLGVGTIHFVSSLDNRPTAPGVLLGSWLLPGFSSVIAYQLAELSRPAPAEPPTDTTWTPTAFTTSNGGGIGVAVDW